MLWQVRAHFAPCGKVLFVRFATTASKAIYIYI